MKWYKNCVRVLAQHFPQIKIKVSEAAHLVDGRVGVDLADVCPVVILPDRGNVKVESPGLLK